jgi:cell division protein FtsB
MGTKDPTKVNKKRTITLGLVFFAMLVLLLVVIFGDNGWVELKRLKDTHRELVADNARLTSENSRMYDIVDRLQNDSEYIENIARQELGMIRSDEVIFKFNHGKKTGE